MTKTVLPIKKRKIVPRICWGTFPKVLQTYVHEDTPDGLVVICPPIPIPPDYVISNQGMNFRERFDAGGNGTGIYDIYDVVGTYYPMQFVAEALAVGVNRLIPKQQTHMMGLLSENSMHFFVSNRCEITAHKQEMCPKKLDHPKDDCCLGMIPVDKKDLFYPEYLKRETVFIDTLPCGAKWRGIVKPENHDADTYPGIFMMMPAVNQLDLVIDPLSGENEINDLLQTLGDNTTYQLVEYE